jgi:hypothetical protein
VKEVRRRRRSRVYVRVKIGSQRQNRGQTDGILGNSRVLKSRRKTCYLVEVVYDTHVRLCIDPLAREKGSCIQA